MHIRKTVAGLGLAVLAAVLPSAKLTAAPSLTSPGDYATVKVQTSEMESFLATPAARTMSTYGTSTKSSATRLTYQGYYAANNTAVTLKWSGTSGSSTVKVYRSSNLNAAVFTQTTSATSLEFWEAEIGRNYTWTVENGGQKATGHFFVARTAPRIINGPHAADPSGDQVANARDLGGWLTTDGKVVKQGKIFRTRQFDWCWAVKADKGKNYNGNKYWSQTIGIKFDLDLREIAGDSGIQACLDNPSNYPLGDGEVNKSPIGPNIPRYCSEMDGVLNFHDGKVSVTDKDCRIAFAHVFDKLIDSSNWPLVFHCAHGKDRTGQLAMITLGLLGVDYNSIALDYSCAWIYKAEWTMGSFEPDDLQDALNARYGSGLTLKAKCEKYVKECAKDAGLTLTDTQIANFRNAMLEMPETAAVNPVGPTPTGTAVVPPTLKTERVKFDRSAHPPTVVDSADKAYYTVTIPSGDYKEPGVFPITVSLKNPSATYWSDTKTSADRTLEYVIYADTEWNNEPCVPSFQQGNAGAAIAFPGYSKRGGGYGAVCNLTPAQLRSLGPGTHEATFTMAESQTWTGTTIKKTFRVLAADEQPQYLYDYLEMSGDSGVSFLTGLTPDCTKERMEISWAFTKAQVLTTEYGLFQSAAKFFVHVGDDDVYNDKIHYCNGYNVAVRAQYSNTASANLGTGLHTVSVCGKTLTFDGVTQSASGAPAENKDAAYPLIICAGYLGGPNYCPTGFRLYGFKVYASASAATPTHDYTPAKLADGTPVLYDLVTKTILPPTYTKASAVVTAGGTARDVPGAGCVHAWSAWSADTATKSAGGSITRTCSKCNESQTRTTPQLWDWLKTDGKGYFNTRWRPDLSTYLINLRIRFGTDVLDAAAVQGLLVGNGHVEKQGAYLNALNLNFEKTGSTRGTGTTWDYDYYSAVSSSGSNAYVGLGGDETRIQEITLSGKTVTLDGKTAGSGSLASGVLSSDLYLMTSYSKSNARFQSMTKGYLYGVTLGSKNGTGTTVAHKYRPALNGTVATLWDEVEGEYLEVLNGGVFSVGNDGTPGPDPSYVYGSPDTANLTYTWRAGNGVWANPAAWTARTPCYGIPSNTTYATAAFPASLTGTPVVTVAGRYPVKAFSFANTVPLTFAFEGENTGFDLAQGPSGYQLFGTGKDETPATTFRFVIPAGGYAAAPIRTLVDDAPVFIGLSTKFVVDASAMAVPSLNTAVTNVLIQATDGVRFFEKKSEPLASTVYGDRVLAAAEITVPAGAKGVLLMDGKKVVFVLRNANWQPEVVPQPESPDIYLLLGQSNMAGYGTLGEVADVDTSRISKWDFENDRWIPATDPLVPGCGVGLGTSFARAMADADSAKEIAVINAAKGATYLAQWQKGTALYDRALEILRLALAKGGTLKGILWHQGCYDAIAETDANTYAARFQELVADLRADLGNATLPIVMGELPRTLDESKLGSRAYWRTVNAQLATAAEALDQAALVTSEGLDTLTVDRTHFTAVSQRTFGVRYATAMQTLQGDAPHVHEWGEWSEDTATKAAGGEQTRHCTCEGCDATETRATPQRWDWLMTDDRGYYITDYVPNLAKTRIEMKVGFLSDDYSGMFTASPMVVGGAKDWTDVMSLQLDLNVDYYNNSLGTQIRPSVGFAREGETHTYDITGNSFSVDGGEPYSLEGKTAADKPASGPLAFLVTHFGNSQGFLYHPSRKVYYIRVTTDGTSAMRLRPAKDGNGVATLWDEVTGEYLPIANGGVFSVGNDSDETQESIDNGLSGDRIVIPSGKTATLLENGQLKVGDKTYAPKEHYVFKAVDGGFALEIAQEEAVVADISIDADGTVTVTSDKVHPDFWYALEESSALPFEPVGEPEWQKLDETGKLSVEGGGQGGFYRLKVTDRDK